MIFLNNTKDVFEQGDWSVLPVDSVLEEVKTSRAGLSQEEVERRIKKYGKNIVAKKDHLKILRHIWSIVSDPIVFILYVSGTVVYLIGHYIDAYIILSTLVLNVIIIFIQDFRVSKAFKLLQNTNKFYARVRRGGSVEQILADDLVVGDIVLIEAGDKVLADMRIIKESDMEINESVLTGEWAPVKKKTVALINPKSTIEQVNMAWKGTNVVRGIGEGVVVATGDQTILGKISQKLHESVSLTPLQKQVSSVAKLILVLIVISIVGIATIAFSQGIPLYEILFLSIAIAVAGIPSGLPAAITVVLVFGMHRILKKNGLVRNILAAETLGSTTWILSDKTGTLTKGEMSLVDIIRPEKLETIPADLSKESRALVQYAYMATGGEKIKEGDDFIYVGSAIEKAFAHACESYCDEKYIRRTDRAVIVPFSSNRRYAATVISTGIGTYTYVFLGAPELILDNATHVNKGGKIVPMTEENRKKYEKQFVTETKKGRRVVALGVRTGVKCSEEEIEHLKEREDDVPVLGPKTNEYVFSGFLSVSDKVREDVPEAVEFIYKSHINITVVTGDNRHTALQIAKESGIVRRGDSKKVLEGSDIKKMTDDELFAAAQYVKVFARMVPDQKSRLLRVLMSRGEVVAMTGDGVNDAASLHKASIGIAVVSGTEVAKETADLILLKNSFTTITDTIVVGRNIISNLKKILIYLLSTSFSEAILVSGGILFTGLLPITPIQILWANIIEEAFISFTFAFEKGDKSNVYINPRDKRNGILSPNVRGIIISLSIITGLFLLALFSVLHGFTDLSNGQVQTIMFIAVSLDSMFLAVSLKQLRRSIFKTNLFDNLWLVAAIVISILLLIAAFFIPFLSEILSLSPIPVTVVAAVILTMVCFHISVIEFLKRSFFKRFNVPQQAAVRGFKQLT